MATSTPISMTEYLRSEIEMDCDVVDGEVQERNGGTLDHSSLLGEVLMLLATHESAAAHIKVNLILRIQVSDTRIRVADICVRRAHPRASRSSALRRYYASRYWHPKISFRRHAKRSSTILRLESGRFGSSIQTCVASLCAPGRLLSSTREANWLSPKLPLRSSSPTSSKSSTNINRCFPTSSDARVAAGW